MGCCARVTCYGWSNRSCQRAQQLMLPLMLPLLLLAAVPGCPLLPAAAAPGDGTALRMRRAPAPPSMDPGAAAGGVWACVVRDFGQLARARVKVAAGRLLSLQRAEGTNWQC